MNNSLQQYIDSQKELYGRDALVFNEGFLIYKAFEDKSLYIHLAYVEPLKRNLGLITTMTDKLVEITETETIHSYVDLTTEVAELSVQAHIGYGFKIVKAINNSLYFIKEVKQKQKGEENE